ncbi:ABC transporter permease [Nitrincola tapanii]|uniref:ABC transporter permease n=1 Tax=Nitrincola tapanii TaxID=1708751 RepID=A0A5A9W8L3_9GAMM|nr:FtsX-like permease family protein [Nitrincola tapanii]KAA0876339.1 ABC transporter permease [Nitrincola tapanii]
MFFQLAWRSLLNRRSSALLTLITIAISVMLLLSVDKLREDTRASFFNTLSGTDLVVGARTGSLPLLLYSVFNIGQPTRNLRWSSYQEISQMEAVDWSIPITLGDSHRGFRVIGTDHNYFAHYRFGRNKQLLSFRAGHAFEDLYDLVIGAEAARALGYELGDPVVVAHGLGRGSFTQHSDKPFRIVGILQPTGTPVDRSLLISLEAWQAIHLDWRAGTRLPGVSISADEARNYDLTPREITAFMLGLNSPLATFHLQRSINQYRAEPLQAILPGVALQELWQVLSVAEKTLLLMSACVVLAGLTGMLAVLLSSLKERRRELAVLRAVGASPGRILLWVVGEAALLTLGGLLLGSLLWYLLLWSVQDTLALDYGIFLQLGWPSVNQLLLLAAVQTSGILVGLIPALGAYRYTLTDGLTPRI